MAADIAGDMRFAKFALHELDRSKHRTFRAAGAEGRVAAGNRSADEFVGGRLVTGNLLNLLLCSIDQPVHASRTNFVKEGDKALHHHVGGVFAAHRQHVLAENARVDVGAAQRGIEHLLDVVGMPLLHHQYGALAGAELRDLIRHHRIGDVHAVDRNARIAERVGKADALHHAQHGVVETALQDDADFVAVTGELFVELVVLDELDRCRQARLKL